jgi:hypothetical protein
MLSDMTLRVYVLPGRPLVFDVIYIPGAASLSESVIPKSSDIETLAPETDCKTGWLK